MIATKPTQQTPNLQNLPLAKFASQTIITLSSICESRNQAINFYPNSYRAKKQLEQIHKIRYRLAQAKQMFNPKEAVIECLSLELSFHNIISDPTKKLRQTYINKVTTVMDACRAKLGRVKQW